MERTFRFLERPHHAAAFCAAAILAAATFCAVVPTSGAASHSPSVTTLTALGSKPDAIPVLTGERSVPLPVSGTSAVPGRGPDPDVRFGGATALLHDSTSVNWAGQVLSGSTFSAVGGKWTVPSVAASATPESDADWIGIGGYNSADLIQTGTSSTTTSGSTTYSAWFELLPAPESLIHEPVSAGDEMEAVIEETTTGQWYVGIEDLTKGWIAHGTVTYTAGSADSAEWITERPYELTTHKFATLADFGSVRFHDLRYAASGTPTTTSISMLDTTGATIAYPGPITATTTGNFTDHYGAPMTSRSTPPRSTPPSISTAPSTTPRTTTPSTSPTPSSTTPPQASLTVTGVSPATGPTAGGTTVTITGTDFTSGATVRFDRVPATHVTFVDSTEITATSPAHAAGNVNVIVSASAGTSPTVSADLFDYLAPKVTSVSARSGPTAGGTTVVITGADFVRGATVHFGTKSATKVTFKSPTRITVVAPAHAAGSVNVVVTIPGGTSATSSADLFEYLAPKVASVSPRSGPTAGRTTVVITGADFVRGATVHFGTKSASKVSVMSPTRIMVVAPAHAAGSVNVVVTIPGGTSPVSGGDRFSYTR